MWKIHPLFWPHYAPLIARLVAHECASFQASLFFQNSEECRFINIHESALLSLLLPLLFVWIGSLSGYKTAILFGFAALRDWLNPPHPQNSHQRAAACV